MVVGRLAPRTARRSARPHGAGLPHLARGPTWLARRGNAARAERQLGQIFMGAGMHEQCRVVRPGFSPKSWAFPGIAPARFGGGGPPTRHTGASLPRRPSLDRTGERLRARQLRPSHHAAPGVAAVPPQPGRPAPRPRPANPANSHALALAVPLHPAVPHCETREDSARRTRGANRARNQTLRGLHRRA